MRLLVGLGNPGTRTSATGTISASWWSRRSPAATASAPWRRRFQGVATEGPIGAERVLLLLPGTYMNESGRAVGEAAHFYKLALSDIVVLHDEIDLPPAKVRVKAGGGIAGHNGLRSITAHIGNDYRRVRIGVGHPGVKELVHGLRARDFAKAERAWVEALVRRHRRQCRAAGERRGRDVSRTRCISPCRRRVSWSGNRPTSRKNSATQERIREPTWDSSAASSVCRMSASRRSSMR